MFYHLKTRLCVLLIKNTCSFASFYNRPLNYNILFQLQYLIRITISCSRYYKLNISKWYIFLNIYNFVNYVVCMHKHYCKSGHMIILNVRIVGDNLKIRRKQNFSSIYVPFVIGLVNSSSANTRSVVVSTR